jgi:hypothetical protein
MAERSEFEPAVPTEVTIGKRSFVSKSAILLISMPAALPLSAISLASVRPKLRPSRWARSHWKRKSPAPQKASTLRMTSREVRSVVGRSTMFKGSPRFALSSENILMSRPSRSDTRRRTRRSRRDNGARARPSLRIHKDAPEFRWARKFGRVAALPILAGLHHQYVRVYVLNRHST